MHNKQLNVIDLFCGCGGLSFGFERAGYNVLVGIDNDKAALRTFEHNHKNSNTICGDITNISYSDIKNVIGDKKIDVIVGGPPCQGMSLSGPRQIHDPRNRLYLSFIRLVEEIKPKGFVIENVPGLIGLFGGAIKDSIIQEFSNLGYQVKYEILDASEYGVPQTRRRVVFVGLQDKMFDFPKPNPLPIVTCEMAIGDLPPLETELGSGAQAYIQPAKCEYQIIMRENSREIYNHVAAEHSERVRCIIALVPEGGNYKSLPPDLRETRNFHVAWTRFDGKKPAPTIDTGHRHHFHYKYNRVPTVRECARIQSFPDSFIFHGNKTEQFRQVGNAVPPILAEQIAGELKKYLS
jgi:DNA (cytosine-5)-methyltransferase 1